MSEKGIDMTEIGETLLNEYKAQIKEHIEDDKNTILTDQFTNVLSGIWRYTKIFINAFFINVLVVATFTLIVTDSSMIQSLRTSSNEEIVNGIKTFFTIVGTLQTFIMFILAVFYYRHYFQNKRQERIDYEEREENLRGLIIEFSEEVLARHGVIKKGLFNE